MPQLDSATYLGQVTWLAVVFGLFYLVVLTDVLPGLNRALKIRSKKLERVRGDARQFDGIRVSAQDALDAQASSVSKRVMGVRMSKRSSLQGYAQAALKSRFGRRGLSTGAKSRVLGLSKPVLPSKVMSKVSSTASSSAKSGTKVKSSSAKGTKGSKTSKSGSR